MNKQIQEMIDNGTRYDLVELSFGEQLVAVTGELRVAQMIITENNAMVKDIMVVPEFSDEGEPTGRTLILIDLTK